jgi:hypothetical protein
VVRLHTSYQDRISVMEKSVVQAETISEQEITAQSEKCSCRRKISMGWIYRLGAGWIYRLGLGVEYTGWGWGWSIQAGVGGWNMQAGELGVECTGCGWSIQVGEMEDGAEL